MVKDTKQNIKVEKKESKGKDTYFSYPEAKITCSCGKEMKVGSTAKETHVEVCSACHPFYTGSQKFIDTGGRLEKFKKRLQKKQAISDKKAKKTEKKKEK